MKRKKRIIAVILLCVLIYALDIVWTIYGPRKSYSTLWEAVEADELFEDFPEMLARSDTEDYTLVVAGKGGEPEQDTNVRVFRKTANGWLSPAQVIFPLSPGQITEVGGDFCNIKVLRIAGSDSYCIYLYIDTSGTTPTFADSLGSDFGVYSDQAISQNGYTAWAVLSAYPKGYTVYINQEAVVIN